MAQTAEEDWRQRRSEQDAAAAKQPDQAAPQRVVPDERYPGNDGKRVVPGQGQYGVDVQVWTDRTDGAAYCVGQPIEIYFQTNVDAYVTIYDIDTRGYVQVLFPGPYGRNRLVRGGQTYRVSPGWGTQLAVTGPRGWEYIRAVAVAADYNRNDYRPGRDDYYRDDDRRDDRRDGDRRDDDYRDGDRRDDNNDGRRIYGGSYDSRQDGKAQVEGGKVQVDGAQPQLAPMPAEDAVDGRWVENWKSRGGVKPGELDRELEKRIRPVPTGRRDVDQAAFYVETRCNQGRSPRFRWPF